MALLALFRLAVPMRFWVGLGLCLAVGPMVRPCSAGVLGDLRSDVRTAAPSDDDDDEEEDHDDHHSHSSCGHHSHCDDDSDSDLGFTLFFFGVTSPFWAPHACLEDNFGAAAAFPSFPYDRVPGYMVREDRLPAYREGQGEWQTFPWCETRRISTRFRTEYGTTFGDLDRIGAHLLLESGSRWGIDAAVDFWEERLPGNLYDRLTLGDCNAVVRFAQSERMQWRTGLGFNWLDDDIDTNYGFNFTYGFDWYPVRPLVFSNTLDWGWIDEAGLFRYRVTTGVILNRFESYVGYEYLDIGRTQINSMIAGLRVWF